MWCMECVWISHRMRLLDRASVCMGGEGVYIYFSIATLFVPFSVLFLGQLIFSLFHGCLCVCCVYACLYVYFCVVWCGVVWLLSLFLSWIVAGMVVGWQDSRAVGDADCNCGYAEEMEEAIAGQGGNYLPRYLSTP